MIQMQTSLDVKDNSGAKKVMCIKVLGGSHRMTANVGDTIVVTVKDVIPGKMKKGHVCKALIVTTKSVIRRSDGSLIKFDTNGVVLLNTQNEPLGTRVFGPVPRELRSKNAKITSLAKEVL